MLSSCFGRGDDGVAAVTVQNVGVQETRARAGLGRGVDGCPGTGVSPGGKGDPPELPNIFQGTALQWRQCVRTCYQYRPLGDQWGVTGKVDISLEKGRLSLQLGTRWRSFGSRANLW